MVAFLTMILINIGIGYLTTLLTPRSNVQPGGLGDFNLPTADDGRPVPVVFGTCEIKGPNVTWYGDLDTIPVKRGRSFLGIPVPTYDIINYAYYLGIEYCLCTGPDVELVGIKIDDRDVPYTVTDHGTFKRLAFNLPVFWGGDESEGGLSGEMDFYAGNVDQEPNDYMETFLGKDLPAYRGVCRVVCRKMYWGNTPYLKPISFIVRRCPNTLGLANGRHNIDGDANPAAMLYDLETEARWGLGMSAGSLDISTYLGAGNTLHSEGFGLSMMVDTASPANDVIAEICRHIDAIEFTDPETGLEALRLVRPDYDVDHLPVLDQSAIKSCKFGRPAWEDTKNAVEVTFTDRSFYFKPGIVRADNLALIQLRSGEIALQRLQFLGISNTALAQKVAARSLKVLSYPAAPLELVINREGSWLKPADVFRLTWAPLGIAGMIVRAGQARSGLLTGGDIEVSAVEDVFGVDWTAYSEPPGSEWVDPGDICALSAQDAICAPYEAVKPYLEPERGDKIMTFAMRGSGVTAGYVAWANNPDGSWENTGTTIKAFTPTGVLRDSVVRTDDTIIIENGKDLWRLETIPEGDFNAGMNIMLIGGHTMGPEEFVAFSSVAFDLDGTVYIQGCARGCIDTIPRSWSAGTRVWFPSYGCGMIRMKDRDPESSFSVPLVRMQPFNDLRTLPFEDCFDSQCGFVGGGKTVAREQAPYCGVNLRVNGQLRPTEVTGNLRFTWEHRNRLGSWSYSNSGVTPEPEPGTHYRILLEGTRVPQSWPTFDFEWLDSDDPDITYTEAEEINRFGAVNTHLRVTLYTETPPSQGSQGSPTGALCSWGEEFDRVP